MNIFLAIAITLAGQWPGDWTEAEVTQAVETAWEESLAEGLIAGAAVGSWVCLTDRSRQYVEAAPVCLRNPTRSSIHRHMEVALKKVLKMQGRLIENPDQPLPRQDSSVDR